MTLFFAASFMIFFACSINCLFSCGSHQYRPFLLLLSSHLARQILLRLQNLSDSVVELLLKSGFIKVRFLVCLQNNIQVVFSRLTCGVLNLFQWVAASFLCWSARDGLLTWHYGRSLGCRFLKSKSGNVKEARGVATKGSYPSH